MAPALLPDFGLPAPGSCTVLSARGGPLGSERLYYKPLYEAVTGGLDAGSPVTLSRPWPFDDIILPQTPVGHYYATNEFPPTPDYGWKRGVSYTFDSGIGGADVRRFHFSSTPSTKTKFSAIGGTIPRSEPLKVTWTAADQDGITIVSGGAATEAAREDDRVSAGFTCTERVSAGEFTIPAAILQMFPKAATRGYLTFMHRRTAIKFEAEGLDSAFFFLRDGFRAGTVTWQ